VVCQVLALPRSTIYAERARTSAPAVSPLRQRRGPKPALCDADLLAAIRDDLKSSPFTGEGHRKVWARLRWLRALVLSEVEGIRVSRTRVLRLMKAHHLLSPHRWPQGIPNLHTGTITTAAPDLMWGTDGIRIETVDEGWVWVFSAIDHCTAPSASLRTGECVGWHAAKIGNRFAALEPIAQGITRYFGGTDAQAARGLALRFDHGTQYMADHFLNQVKFWGMTLSPAFVAEPQTNGVAERFNRTLKEQAIYGRIFRNLHELRLAVGDFIERYNAHWRLEKLGFLSPLEARQAYAIKQAA
jgi:transposase InsO family protein